MIIPVRDYDRCFQGTELRRIRLLRSIDRYRLMISFIFGLVSFCSILAISSFIYSEFSVIGFWLGLLVFVFGGLWLYYFLDMRIEREFTKKWDPLFLERTKISVEEISAREEIISLTDSPYFYGLSEDQKKFAIRKINQKHGINK